MPLSSPPPGSLGAKEIQTLSSPLLQRLKEQRNKRDQDRKEERRRTTLTSVNSQESHDVYLSSSAREARKELLRVKEEIERFLREDDLDKREGEEREEVERKTRSAFSIRPSNPLKPLCPRSPGLLPPSYSSGSLLSLTGASPSSTTPSASLCPSCCHPLSLSLAPATSFCPPPSFLPSSPPFSPSSMFLPVGLAEKDDYLLRKRDKESADNNYKHKEAKQARDDNDEKKVLPGPSFPELVEKARREAGEGEKGRKVRKHRALVAVTPYWPLSPEESHLTVMTRLFGGPFSLWWYKRRKVITFSNWLVVSLGCTGFWLSLLDVMGEQVQRFLYAFVYVFSISYMALQSTSLMNFALLQRTFFMFETLFLLTEAAFFSLSLWASLCFSSVVGVLCLAIFFFLAVTFLLYDSSPVSIRKRLRITMAVFFLWSLAVVAVLQLRIPKDVCYYRLDLAKGLVKLESNINYGLTLRWSFSLFDFCIHRGLTVLVLMAKVIITAYRHPRDCVFIKERVRLLEEMLDDGEERKNAVTGDEGEEGRSRGDARQTKQRGQAGGGHWKPSSSSVVVPTSTIVSSLPSFPPPAPASPTSIAFQTSSLAKNNRTPPG